MWQSGGFRRLPPPRDETTGNFGEGRRGMNVMIVVAVLFVALVGCSVWLTSGGDEPEPAASEGLR